MENERADLVTKTEVATLTDDQIVSILDFAAKLAPGLAEAEEGFAARRVLIGKLRVQAVLIKEDDGRQVVDASWILGNRTFGPVPIDILVDMP